MLEGARSAVLNDVEMFKQGLVPVEKQPLDAGFVNWPEDLLQDAEQNKLENLIADIEQCAARLPRGGMLLRSERRRSPHAPGGA